MIIEVLADPESVAQRAAAVVAAEARSAVAERGRFVVALTGGHTPWIMLRALAREDVPWESLSVVQVDERVAPDRGSCFDVVVVDHPPYSDSSGRR
jgi:6-phosphogluconolactonase